MENENSQKKVKNLVTHELVIQHNTPTLYRTVISMLQGMLFFCFFFCSLLHLMIFFAPSDKQVRNSVRTSALSKHETGALREMCTLGRIAAVHIACLPPLGLRPERIMP